MSAWLEQLFTALSPLWRMSLTGAYVAGIVFFLRLLLKGRAPRQAVCLLWLIVFARLLIPLSLQSPFSARPGPTPNSRPLPLEGRSRRGVAGGGGRHAGLRPAVLAAAAPPPL